MFSYEVDDELSLELLHDGLAREMFLVVDESREHLRPWLPWVDDTRQIQLAGDAFALHIDSRQCAHIHGIVLVDAR